MTTTDEYVPSVKQVRDEWISAMTTDDPDNYWDAITDEEAKGRFDRFLARVRRDAAREALDGLAEQFNNWAEATAEESARIYRDTHYGNGA